MNQGCTGAPAIRLRPGAPAENHAPAAPAGQCNYPGRSWIVEKSEPFKISPIFRQNIFRDHRFRPKLVTRMWTRMILPRMWTKVINQKLCGTFEKVNKVIPRITLFSFQKFQFIVYLFDVNSNVFIVFVRTYKYELEI